MRRLAALFLFQGLSNGTLYGFVPVLLQSRGFDPALVGLSMSLGAAAFTSSLPVWGHVSDMTSGPRRTLQIACVPAGVFALGLAAPIPAWAIICCLVVYRGSNVASSLVDTIALTTIGGDPRAYSRLRPLTSLGSGIAAVGCGLLYGTTGYAFAPFVYLFAIAGMAGVVQLLPQGAGSGRSAAAGPNGEDTGGAAGSGGHGRLGSVGEALSLRPRLVPLMAAAMLIYCGISATWTYAGIELVSRGGGPAQVGIMAGFGYALELPAMVLSGLLIHRFGPRAVLTVSLAGFIGCCVAYIVLPGMLATVGTRVAAGAFVCGIFLSLVLAVASMLPPRLQTTGQAILGASAWGFGAIVSNLVAGALYSHIGPGGTFGFAGVVAFAGAVIAFATLPVGNLHEPMPDGPTREEPAASRGRAGSRSTLLEAKPEELLSDEA
jgi:MFS family permease